MLTLSHLMVNGLTEPVGIRDSIELSWALESDQRNVIQTGYQIQLWEARTLLYDSGSVPSRQSAHVSLAWDWKSITRYTLRVRSAAGDERSQWAETNFVTAFQTPEEWRGSFRSAEPEEDKDQSYGTLLRRRFTISKAVKEAWLVCSAHGIYHAFLNGRAVSPDELAPGWTSYHKHLRYQTYEVTSLLRQGENALGVMLGAGWYKGMMGYKHTRNNYGTRTAFGGQLLLRYTDDTEEWVCTDEGWKGSRGPVLFSEIYDGEVYDARLQGGAQPRKCRLTAEQPGWTEPGFDDSGWRVTEPVPQPVETLIPQQGCPVREMDCVSPVRLFTTPAGERVIDFGQNMAGWCAFTVENATPGDVAELLFFETLDAEGNVYTENLRGIRPRVRYICKGEAREQFRPLFTFQGFQYAQIISWPGVPKLEQFQGRVVYSAMEETASFLCSDPRLNQLWHNILWGMKGNFIDLPTDCPQRDERLGWTGDVVAFAPTSCLLMNTDAFYRKWLADVRADQFANGAVPHVVPDLLTGHMEGDWLLDQDVQGGASGWGDVAVLLPWALYLAYGDKTVLAEQMDSMLRWLDFLERHSEGCLFRFGAQFGDWLALDAAPPSSGTSGAAPLPAGSYKGATPDEYCSAAYYCYVTRLVGKMLRVLGRETEAEALERRAQALTADFQRRFFTSDGRLTVPTQTAHVLALRFDLVPEAWKPQVVQGLKDLLAQSGGHLTTGFLGTPHIAPALSENGCLEEAYALLLKEDCPGWLYQVKAGATTVWEHWDGKKPDGTMWSADMNSFNHYAYGSIGEWMLRTIGGLELDENRPGYEHFFIRPQIGGGLECVEISCRSSYGEIAIKWRKNGDVVTLEAVIPPNTSAEIQLVQAREVLDDGGLVFAEDQAHAGSGRWRVRYRI
ncbi:MAG: glycoside hydrolase family 78 protein [Clostridiales bacterium]|nr:glycoside hydrolase family 78 protein [Clostridiales bacterium]